MAGYHQSHTLHRVPTIPITATVIIRNTQSDLQYIPPSSGSVSGEDTLLHFRCVLTTQGQRARTNTSSASSQTSVVPSRSPFQGHPQFRLFAPPSASRSLSLCFGVRSSGERNVGISSTLLHRTSAFPGEDRDHNCLSDFELFLGHT